MSVSADLAKLSDLYAAGSLSPDEFVTAKAQLLAAPQPPAPQIASVPAVSYAPPQYQPNGYVAPGPSGYQTTPTPHAASDRFLSPYYQFKFARFDAQGGGFSASWNWPAFFLGWLWYLVKGMWAKALITLVLVVVTAGILAIPVWIYCAIAGNYDYYLLKRKQTQFWS